MTAAGISYAESKRELYEQTVSFAMLRWQDRVKNAVFKEETASAKFAVLCSSALLYLSEDKDFSALLNNDPSIFPMFPTVDPYEDINATSVGIIEEILSLGMKTGEFRELVPFRQMAKQNINNLSERIAANICRSSRLPLRLSTDSQKKQTAIA